MSDTQDARTRQGDAEEITRLMNGMELAWGIIANAYGGNWDKADPGWRDAATRWRDEHWHPSLNRNGYPARDEETKRVVEDLDGRFGSLEAEEVEIEFEEQGYDSVCGPDIDAFPGDVVGWITAFAAWLTTRDENLTVGRNFDAAPMAEVVGEYLKLYDLPEEISETFWHWLRWTRSGGRMLETSSVWSYPPALEDRLRVLEKRQGELEKRLEDSGQDWAQDA